MPLVLALDQGTTSSRAILFDEDGQIVAVAQKEFPQIYPRAGWVEHDPEAIWSTQIGVAAEVMARAGIRASDLTALGITNQRETAIVWDRRTGRPIGNAIVWQDRRTAGICDRLRDAGHEPLIREKTGLVIDAYFSGPKVAWLLDHVSGARKRAQAGELAFGTVDAWLIWKLTAGRLHVTDATNASRTMLYNIHTGQWDDELLSLMDVPRDVLPEVRGCSEVIAAASELSGLPIAGVAGDQQAALIGQACFTPGTAKNTYGTGCFLLIHTGDDAGVSPTRLITTIARRIGDRIEYALEGSVFIAGAVVQWLRDGLGIIRSADQIEPLARSVPDNHGVYFVPAFAGLGAPHWDAYARGAIVGLTRGVTAAHLARAALEGIAHQVADVIDAARAGDHVNLSELRVDGGAAANDLLMQMQADLLQLPVVRPAVTETTALGAAYLAGMATGVWKNDDDVAAHWRVERRFEPRISADESAARRAQWNAAVKRATHWASPDDG